MTTVLLRMPSGRAVLAAGLLAIFALAGSLTVALADDPTSADPTVQASPAPSADPELTPDASAMPDPVIDPQAVPTLPSPASGGGIEVAPTLPSPRRGGNEAAATLPSPGGGGNQVLRGGGNGPSVLDRVEIIMAAPVQSAIARRADVMAFFRPRPWLVALFLGLTIAILAMLAAGFREKRQLARI